MADTLKVNAEHCICLNYYRVSYYDSQCNHKTVTVVANSMANAIFSKVLDGVSVVKIEDMGPCYIDIYQGIINNLSINREEFIDNLIAKFDRK